MIVMIMKIYFNERKYIVSLADSNYFELLNELMNSIQKFNQSKSIAICILDAGLTKEQKKTLSLKVDEIKNAEWDIEVPGFKVRGKEWLKSQVSRAFLPSYFLIIKSIYGLIVMLGFKSGHLLNFILKLVKMVNLELLKPWPLVIK